MDTSDEQNPLCLSIPGIEVVGIIKNVPLKKRVIVRTNLSELILEIMLCLSGTFFR